MPQTPFLRAALAAADWFVNTQVLMQKPHWDGNHGRLVYTYHMPSKTRVLGLSWTQGRGIVVLLSAYEATGKTQYLKAALQAGEYIKHLQVMDSRDKRCFGAIREECPASWYVYTRDALEAALGLIFLHRATGVPEWLERARIFGDWFVDEAMGGADWAPAAFYLDPNEKNKLPGYMFFLAGGAPFLAYLSKATNNPKYLKRGFRPLMERLVRDYVRESDGMLLTAAKGSDEAASGHHESADARYRGVALNDDGCGYALLVAHKELNEKRYLDLAVRYGEAMMADRYPLPCHAGLPLRALTLAEISRAANDPRFAQFAARTLAPLLLEKQVSGSGDAACEGAFRGEDEAPEWYAPKGSHALEFVNTRMTAYAASALFKLDGTVFGPYYSACDWDRPVPPPPAETLHPYRI